jgi:MIP family channel proteins
MVEAREASLPVRLAAESLGTFALVFVAVGGDAMARVSGGAVSDAARAVAPALMVAALIYAIGDVSGAHFNPAVTAAFALKRLFPTRLVPAYWLAQIIGALLAAVVVGWLFGDALDAGVSTPHVVLAPGRGPATLAIEAVLSSLLIVVILGTADRHRVVGASAAIAVGGTIALCGLIALPIEGASMNPARSLAPALVTGQTQELWMYLLGPIAGAVIAVLVTSALHGRTDADPASRDAAQGDDNANKASPRSS